MKRNNLINKRGQVTIFVILAIIIVGSILAFFALRGGFEKGLSSELKPAYDYYISCLENTAREGISLLGEQGGYIETPDFEPGSAYSPFSSHLDFFGQGVPYWMYVSGNNLLKEQMPTKSEMELQLGDYVSDRLDSCDFSDLELQGYDFYVGGGVVDITINNLDVDISAKNLLTIYKGNNSAVIREHSISTDSKLGKFYDMAVKVYDFEKENMFLENYALDVMRLYAPVTGTEITCTPKIFIDEDITKNIVEGLAANIPSLKLEGNYFELSSKERDYFVKDVGFNVDENVNFMYSTNWPTRVEIYGDKVVEPVGIQEGLGILGFCYVPYHLVYDINFPVMVQFYDKEEIFQFPLAVIISKNQPRLALPTNSGKSIESEICEFKNQEVDVFTYDLNLNPVEARVGFKCLNSVCSIGETKFSGNDAVLKGDFPQCVNGFVTARAEGYADARAQLSTNEEGIVNIGMYRKFNLSLDLGTTKKAFISFSSDDYSASALYPEMNSIELIEANYNITVYAYDDSTLKFPAVNQRKCVDVPASGIAGFFGSETEKCFDVNIPEMDISFAVVGGGKAKEYITEGQLEVADILFLDIPSFGTPKDLEAMQENHLSVESEIVRLSLR